MAHPPLLKTMMNKPDPLGRLRLRALASARSAEQRQLWQERLNAAPFTRQFGFRIDMSDSQLLSVHVDEIRPYHRGGLGTPAVNGAILSAMFDIGLGLAGGAQYPERPTGTIDLSIKLMKPTLGPQLRLYAWAVERRANVVFAEAEVHDDTNGVTLIGQGLVGVSTSLERNGGSS